MSSFITLRLIKKTNLSCMGAFLTRLSVRAFCVSFAYTEQKRVSGALGVTILSHHVSAGNQTVGPLEEQPALLTPEPSSWPLYVRICFVCDSQRTT